MFSRITRIYKIFFSVIKVKLQLCSNSPIKKILNFIFHWIISDLHQFVKVEYGINNDEIRPPNDPSTKTPLTRVRLSLEQKQKLIEESMQPGFSQAIAARKYGVSTSSVCGILKKKFDIYCHPARDAKNARKNLTWGKNDVLESKLYEWYLQQAPLGNPVNGPILIAKARELSQSYDCYAESGFKFSVGWLDGFKRRHNIALSNKTYKKGKPGQRESKKKAKLDLSGVDIYQTKAQDAPRDFSLPPLPPHLSHPSHSHHNL